MRSKSLGKPNDAEYQNFRFSFRIHTIFVSSVSQTLMDKCEAERNQIALACSCEGASRSLFYMLYIDVFLVGFDHEQEHGVSCTADMRHTQNLAHPMIQNIMMLVKLWCGHIEGFESGLRAGELDVGE